MIPYLEPKAEKIRFGRLLRSHLPIGELRRQKKAPYKTVLYIVTDDNTMEMRSICNCTNDELTSAIKRTAEHLGAFDTPGDGEQLLDMLYQELGKRCGI